MHPVQHTPVIICFMIITYLILVGSISWVAWKRRDDGICGLALALCTGTLALVLFAARHYFPKALVLILYYTLLGQAHTFLLYGVLKNIRQPFDWKLGELPVLLLLVCNIYLCGHDASQVSISFLIYSIQFVIIAMVVHRPKQHHPHCGSNMVLTGMCLATVFSLWWAYQIFTERSFLQAASHPADFQNQLDFLTYIISLLISCGFILMTKERIEAELATNRSRDELTGLQPDLWLADSARKALNRLQHLAIPVTLLLIDIDHLRDINSQYGNACGDRILQELGTILEQATPECEIYRMQEGNFAVLISGLNIYQVTDRTEALQVAVRNHDFPNVGQVTICCGISAGISTDGWGTWLTRARIALQRAKMYGAPSVNVYEMDFCETNLPAGVRRVGRLHWRPEYTTGHTELDTQHQMLLEHSNVLLQLWAKTTDRDTIANTVTRYISQVQNHFLFECDYLRKQFCPTPEKLIRDHETAHAQILSRAEDLLSRYRKNLLSRDALLNYLVFEFVLPHTHTDDLEIIRKLSGTR